MMLLAHCAAKSITFRDALRSVVVLRQRQGELSGILRAQSYAQLFPKWVDN